MPHQRKSQEKGFVKQKYIAKKKNSQNQKVLLRWKRNYWKKKIQWKKKKRREIYLIVEQKEKGVENRDGKVKLRD